MSNVILSNAKNTHYAVSTVAAVIYALVWMATTHAHAETSIADASMPEVVVTAKRDSVQAGIPEVVVWGTRETTAPMEEVVVYGHRETTADEPRVAAVSAGPTTLGASAKAGGGLIVTVRHWLQTAFR